MVKFLTVLNNYKAKIISSLFPVKFALVVLLGQVFLPLLSDAGEKTALDGFDQFAKQDGRIVLGITGFSGSPSPEQWLILCREKGATGGLFEVVWKDGKPVGQRKVFPLPGQDIPELPFVRERIRIDSDRAFALARGAVEQRFDSVHFHLRCRESGAEPVWMLSLRNTASVEIGKVYLSAESGRILRLVGVNADVRMETSVPLRKDESGR